MTTQTTRSTTAEKLINFVNQRPGLDFNNYGEMKAYRTEMREIIKDKSDFFELLSLAQARINGFEAKLTNFLTRTDDRLLLNKDGNLEYVTGQYFPTEYRPAAARVVANLIWTDYRDEIEDNTPNPVYTTGQEIRKALSRRVSKRIMKLYFN